MRIFIFLEHRCHVIYVDTFSVNLSVEAEEVVALFKCVINPVSAGTPQEMAYAESMVRTVKRRSTAMMQGAPHLGPEYWGLCDKCAVYLHDFLPISSRKFSCPYFLRTGESCTLGHLVYPQHGSAAGVCPHGWSCSQKGGDE